MSRSVNSGVLSTSNSAFVQYEESFEDDDNVSMVSHVTVREGILKNVRELALRTSTTSTVNSMKNHFAIFSNLYWRDDEHNPVVKDDGNPYSFEEIPLNLINSHLVGTFATYLAEKALRLKRPFHLLDSTTAIGYFSAFKVHLKERFPDKDIPALSPDNHSRNLSSIRKIKTDYNRNNRRTITKKYEPASEKGKKGIYHSLLLGW